MRVLADENQHSLVVARLRAEGYDVEWIAETTPGAADADILRRPDIGSVVLLTYDRDFGDLIFNRGYPAPHAIYYTRLNRVAPEIIATRLIALLADGVMAGQMIAITKDGFRTKPFPLGGLNG